MNHKGALNAEKQESHREEAIQASIPVTDLPIGIMEAAVGNTQVIICLEP